MKLEGSLDAFSLPDIFQLLSFTKKSGGLHLAHDRADGVVFFTAGQVTGASADSSRQPLARRIVGSGAVSDEALAAAVEAVAAGEGIGVVRALLDSGAVDGDLLRQAAVEQATDAIFDLLRWREGDFAFVMDEVNPDEVGVSLVVEDVLADAEARRANWDSVSQVVPSPQAVLVMPVVLGAEPTVSREEWALLALVDGRRTVAELVDLTGSGQYAVVSTLAALVQRGLLEVRPDGAAEDHVTVVQRRHELLSPLEVFTPVVVPAEPLADVHPEVPELHERHRAPADGDARDDSGGAEDRDSYEDRDGVDDSHSVDDSLDSVDTAGTAGADLGEGEPAGEGAPEGDREPALATAGLAGLPGHDQPEQPQMLGGAHVPADVVPPRPEPFLPKRQADFDDAGLAGDAVHGGHAGAPGSRPTGSVGSGGGGNLGDVVGATAEAPDPAAASVIERDPNVNRSLMLRLIAGVRGL
jgi:hypothetical protein